MCGRGDIIHMNPENVDELRAAIMAEKATKKKSKKRKLAADSDKAVGTLAVSRGDGMFN